MATSVNPRVSPTRPLKGSKNDKLPAALNGRLKQSLQSNGFMHLPQLLQGEHLSGAEAAQIVERGLPTASVAALRDWGLTFTEVHDLVLPARTMKHRISKSQPLSMEETDRAIRIAKVFALADRVFGAHDRALEWLRHPSRRLQDRAPLQLLRSEAGGGLITEMLYQIDEGMVV